MENTDPESKKESPKFKPEQPETPIPDRHYRHDNMQSPYINNTDELDHDSNCEDNQYDQYNKDLINFEKEERKSQDEDDD